MKRVVVSAISLALLEGALVFGRSTPSSDPWANYPAKAGETKGLSHEDLMIVYPAPGRGDGVVFESDPAEAAGPRFRLDYSLAADGRLTLAFSMAAPGGDFKEYARGVLAKKS